ncbi:hypothetical protein [Lentzea flava]|uniref:L,D-transpeptidase catalytic domain n=1 Tax=Lentzea flava TaxID=103732 RepID=A0ABQ2UMP0_9PSEU|nr:hypothetical protein [Lentzea flava]MCP2204825.1 hypothetical protein [Lentzea flava]GGU44483.1 hypothetical protein GCM10010178_41150 [Lentzea flava]
MDVAAHAAAVDGEGVRTRRNEEEPAHEASRGPRPAPDHDLLRLQATAGNQATVAHVQRQSHGAAPRVGTRFRHPAGVRSPHRSITAEFDGQMFRVRAGSTVLMAVEAASGRPVSVRSGDARTCGGATSESYKNNPRYVGISDFGPIPEGTFTFRAAEFGLFDQVEQLRMIGGGSFTDPFGQALHGGDWGAGRAPLHPAHVVPAPRGCGNTGRRSGFYIHGGSLSGSSGCIDIGNAGITQLLGHLAGYTGTVTVTVHYAHPAPDVGRLERAIGGATYPGQRDPSLLDRVRGAWDQLRGNESTEH